MHKVLFPFQLPHTFLLLQLFQSGQINLRLKLAQKFKKLYFCKEIFEEDIFDEF